MAIVDTAGTVLTFDGHSLTNLTDLSVKLGDAQEYEVVSLNATVRGTGAWAVPMTRVMVGAAKPGTVSATGLGVDEWFSIGKIGWYGPLVIAHPTLANLSVSAFLKDVERTAKVNDVWQYRVTFQLTEFP